MGHATLSAYLALLPRDATCLSLNFRNQAQRTSASRTRARTHFPGPLIVVLVCHNTLVHHSSLVPGGKRETVTRPYLSTFFQYLFSAQKGPLSHLRRQIQTVIFTGMRAHNILTVLMSLGSPPPRRQTAFSQPSRVNADSPLSLVLSREDLDLGMDYFENVDTVKDLCLVWQTLGIEEEDGVKRTVILTGQAFDAVSNFCSDLTMLARAQHAWRPSNSAILSRPPSLTRICSSRSFYRPTPQTTIPPSSLLSPSLRNYLNRSMFPPSSATAGSCPLA